MDKAIIVRLDEQFQEKLKRVQEALDYPNISEEEAILTLIDEAYFDVVGEAANQPSSPVSVEEVLQPNISREVRVKSFEDEPKKSPHHTDFNKMFTGLLELYPNDPWLIRVRDMTEDKDIWQRALCTTYMAILGKQRAEFSTWVLIEKSFRLMRGIQTPIDNGAAA